MIISYDIIAMAHCDRVGAPRGVLINTVHVAQRFSSCRSRQDKLSESDTTSHPVFHIENDVLSMPSSQRKVFDHASQMGVSCKGFGGSQGVILNVRKGRENNQPVGQQPSSYCTLTKAWINTGFPS